MKQMLAALALVVSGQAAYADEARCMALNLYFEARGGTEEEQAAIAGVVLNRVADRRWPSTVCGVVHQARRKNGNIVKHKCQFSWYCDGRSDQPKDAQAWARAKRVAETATRWYKQGEDFSGGATHYHADYVSPRWARKLQRTTKIGTHIFYK